MSQQRLIVLSFLFSCLAVTVMQCSNETKKDIRGEQYADTQSCLKCHGDIVSDYKQHAHFRASTVVDPQHTIDAFNLPLDTFVFNQGTKVGVEKRNNGLYQVAYVGGKEMKAEKIDVVFGAGKSAYTFAFWYGNQLMQHPLNYLTKQQEWVNSPGFPTDQIYFGRPIITKCIACHGSFVTKKLVQVAGQLQIEEEFVKESLLPGIDCQRCHGPAAAHVAFHEAHPEEKEPHEMMPFKTLSRSQRVATCAVCHSGGNALSLTSNFFFKPGDTLYNLPDYSDFTGEDPDVHGKQNQLLQASKCYQLSNMDCQSCHSVHRQEQADLAVYSQKCMQCHQEVKHERLSLQEKAVVSKNCIDCHMPIKSSTLIGFQKNNSKDQYPYQVRTHHIAVYGPEK